MLAYFSLMHTELPEIERASIRLADICETPPDAAQSCENRARALLRGVAIMELACLCGLALALLAFIISIAG